MILTGKALLDFGTWVFNEYGISYADNHRPVYLNALIIEWLDSVGIYIETFNEFGAFGISIHKGDYRNPIESIGHWNSRQESTNAAIKKANDIYNGI